MIYVLKILHTTATLAHVLILINVRFKATGVFLIYLFIKLISVTPSHWRNYSFTETMVPQNDN